MATSTNKIALLEPSQGHAPGRANTLIEMDQRKNEFMTTLAHELRNPLTPIHRLR